MAGLTGLDSVTYRVLSDGSPTPRPTFYDALGTYRSISGTFPTPSIELTAVCTTSRDTR